jgi:hypothetical protein
MDLPAHIGIIRDDVVLADGECQTTYASQC